MLHYLPKELKVPKLHQLLLGGVGPRPIALVSTLSEEGVPNLAPFSFFNVFGSNPPIIAFSASRRGRDATFKDTYNNLINTKECVVQSVTYQIVEQINLASGEFSSSINEFNKSGLTPVDSDIVKPKRVKESPFQMECILRDMMSYGEGGASPNIAICEVLKLHISEDIFIDGAIKPDLIDLVGRMPANYYVRASGAAVFEVKKTDSKNIMGYDRLPDYIKNSNTYSANNLGKFGNYENIPSDIEVNDFINEIQSKEIKDFEFTVEAFYRYKRHKNFEKMLKAAIHFEHKNHPKRKYFIELTAKTAIENGDINFAWKTAVYAGKI